MRKGSVLDLFFVILIAFVFSISVLIAWTVADEVQTGIDEAVNNTDVASTWNTSYMDYGKSGLDIFNNMFLFIIIGLGLAVGVTAFFIPTHPAFFIITLIVFIISLTVAGIFSNVYTELASTSAFVSIGNEYSLITQAMQNLPIILLVIGVILLVVLYGKMRTAGSEV